jgi:hypothetical protein
MACYGDSFTFYFYYNILTVSQIILKFGALVVMTSSIAERCQHSLHGSDVNIIYSNNFSFFKNPKWNVFTNMIYFYFN